MKESKSWVEKQRDVEAFLRSEKVEIPEVMVVLGSSLGSTIDSYEKKRVIPFGQIPHLHRAAAKTHAGNLVFTEVAGRGVVFQQGRLHVYEGYDVRETTLLVNTLGKMGCKILVSTDLAGGITGREEDVVLVTDHIYFAGDNPIIGLEESFDDKQFVNMVGAYSERLVTLAESVAREEGVSQVRKGVFAYLTGPSFETRQELKVLKSWGADVVSWSMVPEVMVGVYRGMEVLALSCVSDVSDPDGLAPVDLVSLYKHGGRAAKKVEKLIAGMLRRRDLCL